MVQKQLWLCPCLIHYPIQEQATYITSQQLPSCRFDGECPFIKLFISIVRTVLKATRTYALIKLFVLVQRIFFFLGGKERGRGGGLIILGHHLETLEHLQAEVPSPAYPALSSRRGETLARQFTACCLMTNKQLIMTEPRSPSRTSF